MSLKKVVIAAFFFISLAGALQARDDEELKEVLARMGLTLTVPEGFKEIPKVPQGETGAYYDKGYKQDNLDFEVRFFVMPIEDMSRIDPDGFFRRFPQTIIFNITLNMYYATHDDYITNFPENAVREDFGGDMGYSCLVTGQSDFMKGYEWAMVTVVYKKEKGLFMVFQLFNDKEIMMKHQEAVESSFYILKYASE
jgi:hypothetical protein